MLLVTGTIKVESTEEIARVTEALNRRAEKSRNDNGCIDYVFSVNLEDPREIRLLEKWQSETLLQAHLQIPDEEFNSILSSVKIERMIVVANEVTTEQELVNR